MQNLYRVAVIEKSAGPICFWVANVKAYSKTDKTGEKLHIGIC